MNISKNTVSMVKIAILSALSFVLMVFEFPLPAFPIFLNMDLSEVPVLLGTFALGPLSGLVIEMIKNILHFFITKTSGIGELANFIVGASFAVTAGAIYKYHKTKKAAIISLIAGTAIMTLTAFFANYYILIPLYQELLKFPDARNHLIVDIRTLVVYGIIPFNIIKGISVSAVVIALYKKVSPILHK